MNTNTCTDHHPHMRLSPSYSNNGYLTTIGEISVLRVQRNYHQMNDIFLIPYVLIEIGAFCSILVDVTHTASPSPPSPRASKALWWGLVPGTSWRLHFLVQQEYSPLASPHAPATGPTIDERYYVMFLKPFGSHWALLDLKMLPLWVLEAVSRSCITRDSMTFNSVKL